MSFKKANGGKVNPNYTGIDDGYSYNCQTCVAVFEARLRGYDLEAVPFDASNPTMKKLGIAPWSAYKDPSTGEYPKIYESNATTDEECERWLKEKIKNRERYVFGYRPGLVRGKHVIQVQKNFLGSLQFYDPQTGKILQSQKVLDNAFKWKKYGYDTFHSNPIIFRIDNTELDIDFLNNILKPNS